MDALINDIDCIVVGSGPSGVMAAQTLIESGAKVLMIDAGIHAATHSGGKNFDQVRQTDPDQYKVWLGENLEALEPAGNQTGLQLTPARRHLVQRVNELTPFLSDSFFPAESLAQQGLGGAWGLGCCAFSMTELEKTGLSVASMQTAYQIIADRIGISYTKDDIEPYVMPGIRNLQPAIAIDANASALLKQYLQQRTKWKQTGFSMGVSALALLTQDKDYRQATKGNNLEFYSNEGDAAWRPAVTLQTLLQQPGFIYQPGWLVLSFTEKEDRVSVKAKSIYDNLEMIFSARKVVLAANVLGTARIVLRSFGNYEHRLSLLCNSYTYMPCLQWRRLGKTDDQPRCATAQLSVFHDPQLNNSDVSMASLYSYHTLMLFRVIQQAPVGFKDARVLMRYLLPAVTIAGIHQPDVMSDQKWVRLIKTATSLTGDQLQAQYQLTYEEKICQLKREKQFAAFMRKLGAIPLKRIHPGAGASIHYAGTLPFSNEEKPFCLREGGRLSQTKHVYVADGSGFKYLPAKGITLSLMANAHLTALHVIRNH